MNQVQKNEKEKDIGEKNYIQRNRRILWGLLSFNAVVWLLLPFGIILPIIGGIWVQLVWTGLVVWYMNKVYPDTQKGKKYGRTILTVLWLVINLFGSWFWSHPWLGTWYFKYPFNQAGSCQGQTIYTKNLFLAITGDAQSKAEYYKTHFPLLYLQRVSSSDKMFLVDKFVSYDRKISESNIGHFLVCIEAKDNYRTIPKGIEKNDFERKNIEKLLNKQ
jgi:hypothetical protein